MLQLGEVFWLSSRIVIIVVTGPPCSGKTTFLATAKQWLEDRGIFVRILPETATYFVNLGFSTISGWRTDLDFQRHVLRYQLSAEETIIRMMLDQDTDKPMVLLCDRGACDGAAYIGIERFSRICRDLGLTRERILTRPHLVIHLVTAAIDAPEFYTCENNEARTETPEQARMLDLLTREAWAGHPRHPYVSAPRMAEKMVRAFHPIARMLQMPGAREQERWFRIHNFSYTMLPPGATRIDIVQTYLSPDEKGAERRVRMRTIGEDRSYYYAEKRLTNIPGVRDEYERPITAERYAELLTQQDPETRMVHKTRYAFLCNGHHFELDVFHAPCSLVKLEAEVHDMSAPINLPDGWEAEEVTGNPLYSTRGIAAAALMH